MRKKRKNGLTTGVLNTQPYMDLGFVLLIFFVMLFSFQKETAVEVIKGTMLDNCGSYRNWCAHNPAIRVSLNRSGSLRFSHDKTTYNLSEKEAINQLIFEMLSELPTDRVWLFVADDVPLSLSLEATDIFKKQGITHIVWGNTNRHKYLNNLTN
ncbi:hypothetical protein AMS58_17075 [Pseudoalteromonas porphyrae]|uniref:Biopolymer transporter ExbD n=2 Tax=Pseudoalteromonas TaxID=53246 RepID=A0A0N1MTP8_9GAMM|nr:MULTISPECIES: biopolymer transporter ExbD [Pseudoalteromonas]KPH59664.1 hypothetical protein ADS77_16910 [Pseudoalteromonas porphyrae]KPH93452.1 hypothetical protein AMS58_17075 [Pseudoalteromonas porphyrae]